MNASVPVRRSEIIGVLSLAVDFAIGQPVGYGLRSAVASMNLARALGAGGDFSSEVYYQGLLQACGCNAETDILNALFGDEIALRQDVVRIERAAPDQMLALVLGHTGAARAELAVPQAFGDAAYRAIMGAANRVFASHCEVASKLAARLGLSGAVQRNLSQVHERWDGAGTPDGLAGAAIAPAVRLVSVVHHCIRLSGFLPREDVAKTIVSRRGAAYDPDVVDAVVPRLASLIEDASEEAAWASAIGDCPPDDLVLDHAALDAALEVLADFIDLKSPTIAGHSRAVSALVEAAAEAANLPPAERVFLRRAGLVHDIGYTAIPGTQRLMQEGSEQNRLHPYFAERLLCRVSGLASIGAAVSQHHERMDGSGFHRGGRGSDLSQAGRLIAVAEAYQNLVEDRPGRAALTPKQAAQRLRDDARRGSLDGDALVAVLEAAGQSGRTKRVPHAGGLTAREIEVLQRVARGGTTKEIGRDLGLSPKTVDNHIQSIYAKLGIKTRGGATLFALENGLLPVKA